LAARYETSTDGNLNAWPAGNAEAGDPPTASQAGARVIHAGEL